MREIEREAKRVSERGAEGEAGSSASAVEACGDCEVEKGGSSSSTNSGDDLSDEDNLPSDTKEGVAISRSTQARPKVRSRKSQATLGECLKCKERKLKIRLLHKQNGRLRSQREKWKAAARRLEVSASFM